MKNNHQNKNTFTDYSENRLSFDEKNIIKNKLLEYIKENPLSKRQDLVVSPFSLKNRNKHRFLFVSLATFLFFSAPVMGMFYASEKSLPGETFWGLKLAIDNVRYSLTFSDEAKAKLAISLTEKRLDEVAKVASSSGFNSEEIKNISSGVNRQIKSVDSLTNKLKTSKPQLALAVNENLNQAIFVSDNVLKTIKEINPDLKKELLSVTDSSTSSANLVIVSNQKEISDSLSLQENKDSSLSLAQEKADELKKQLKLLSEIAVDEIVITSYDLKVEDQESTENKDLIFSSLENTDIDVYSNTVTEKTSLDIFLKATSDLESSLNLIEQGKGLEALDILRNALLETKTVLKTRELIK